MGARQSRCGPIIAMYLELLHTSHALQCCEPLQWYLGGTCGKLKEFCTMCLVKGTQCTPEPLDLQGVGLVFVVLGVLSEVVNVNIRETCGKYFIKC